MYIKNNLSLNERLETLEELKSNKTKVEFSPEEFRIEYADSNKAKYIINRMDAAIFFLSLKFETINNQIIISYKAIDNSMGIYRLGSGVENVYVDLIIATNEFYEFIENS